MNSTTSTQLWEVIDAHTQTRVATAKTMKGAYRIADRKDLQYGAVRYIVRRAS